MLFATILRFEGDGLNFGSFRGLCGNDGTMIDMITHLIFTDPDFQCNKGVEAVHRVSFSLTLFFSLLLVVSHFLPRVHRGFWMIKLVLFLVLLLISLFVNGFSSAEYSKVSRFGGMMFLILQIFLLIDFVYQLNETLVEQERIKAVLALSFLLVATSLAGIVCLFVFYSACTEGIVFTVLTLLFSTAVLTLSLLRHRFIDDCEGTLLPTCAVIFYSVYLAWSSLESNHRECRHESGGTDAQTTVSIVLGSLLSTASLMWATFSVSSNIHQRAVGGGDAEQGTVSISETGRPAFAHHLMQENEDEDRVVEVEEPVTEPLWSFYLIMLFASMYMSMLLTDWGTKTVQAPKADDNSAMASMYVKIAAQWVTLALFAWTLIAPAVLKDREF